MSKRIIRAAVTVCLLALAVPSHAYYGGYGYHGGHYGHGRYHHRGYYHGGYRSHHGHRYAYRHYGPGYRRYSARHHSYRYRYRPGLLHGLLSIPAAVTHGIFGSRGYTSGTRTHDAAPSATASPPAYPTVGEQDSGSEAGNVASVERAPDRASGWQHLAEQRFESALRAFAAQALEDPENGVPKVGYALAAASAGDLERGVWAMRRAMRIGPDSLHYLDIDEHLRAVVERLIERYRPARDADGSFMVASLAYVAGDEQTARSSLAAALEAGDDAPSTTNLRSLLGE